MTTDAEAMVAASPDVEEEPLFIKRITPEGRGKDRDYKMEYCRRGTAEFHCIGYAPNILEAEKKLNKHVHRLLLDEPQPVASEEEPNPPAPPPLLALLEQGTRLREAASIYRRCLELRFTQNAEQQALRATLRTSPLLPLLAHLGYQQDEGSGNWMPIHYHVETGRGTLSAQVPSTITSAAREDGWIVQTITLQALADVVATALKGLDARIQPYAPGLLSYGLAGIPGPAWTLTENQQAITRLLPPWPLRVPVADEPAQGYFGARDERMPVNAWAVDTPYAANGKPASNQPCRLVFCSTTLPPSRAKQLRANLIRNPTQAKPLRLALPDGPAKVLHATRWCDEGQPYDMLATPVGEGQMHMVVQHTSVLAPAGGDFYHITGTDGVPDWDLLWAQLDAALVLAFPQDALPAIWAAALAEGLITPLRSYGCQGYQIAADQPRRWALVIGTALDIVATVTMHGGLAVDAATDPDDADADDADDTDDDL